MKVDGVENNINPAKKFTVTMTLAELALVAALSGHTNSNRASLMVEEDLNKVLGDYIIINDVNADVFNASIGAVRKELHK